MVSIIILSFNTKDLLRNCLSSIGRNLKDVEHEVIVVDNNSHDDSVEMIKKFFKEVRLIKNEENVGFSKGINMGAKIAKGDFFLFLNSDTELLNKGIAESEKLFRQETSIGIIGGVFKNKDGSFQKSFGSIYNIPQVFSLLFLGERLNHNQPLQELTDVGWVSGGFLMIRKELFKKLLLDENFFMYVEDMELCYRVKKHGFRVVVSPSMTAIHLGQGSSSRKFAIIGIYKGLIYFYKKHKNFLEQLILRLLLLLKAVFAMIVGVLKRDSRLICTYKEALSVV